MRNTTLFNSATTQKSSLILAGGGMRLAYQAGVLKAMEEAGLSFQHVDGTSGGIFNTAMLASGCTPEQMCSLWIALKMKSFLSLRKWSRYLTPLKMEGYTDADNIREIVFPNLNIDIDKIKNNSAFIATFNVCNFSEKCVEAIPNATVKEDHLIAGVSLPMVMPALKIGKDWYTDAVWIKDANLLEGLRQGSETLWLVWAIGNNTDYLPGALNQYVHMIEMSANGALLEEYNQIEHYNQGIDTCSDAKKSPVRLKVIKPEYPLPLDPDLFFDKIDARTLINMGYSDAKKGIDSQPELGVALSPEATKMKTPGDRFCTRFVFKGALLWESTKCNTIVYLYCRLHDFNPETRLECFSSIHLQYLGKEISLYGLQAKAQSDPTEKTLLLEGKFDHESTQYTLRLHLPRCSELDFLIGLGYKQIRIQIKKAQEDQFLMEGIVHQPTTSRLQSLYTTNVRLKNGTAGNWFKKYSMAKKFTTYAV